jgi:hypothetical protein
VRRLLAVLAAAVVLWPSPALGHGDTGFFELSEAAADGSSVEYAVVLRYQNDSEPVEGATVTLVASGPDGVTIGPMPLTDAGGGRYEATVDYPGPGVWGVRIESTAPAAVLERPETVGAPTTTASTTTTTTAATPTTETAASSEEDDGGGGGGVRPATVVAVGVATVAVAFVLRRQRDVQKANR